MGVYYKVDILFLLTDYLAAQSHGIAVCGEPAESDLIAVLDQTNRFPLSALLIVKNLNRLSRCCYQAKNIPEAMIGEHGHRHSMLGGHELRGRHFPKRKEIRIGGSNPSFLNDRSYNS